MAGRRSRMNGWQRLWVVGTVFVVFAFGIVTPYLQLSRSYPYDYQWATQKDYDNPNCASYFELRFEQLTEPPFVNGGGSCWHIYTSRKHEDGHRAFPTYADWRAEDNADWWNNVWGMLAGMSVIVLMLSLVVYGLGMVVAWVIRGFRAA